MSDAVNKPAHYNQGSIECIEAMKIVLTPEEFRGYLKGNVFKYLWREKDKNGIEDLHKGKSYFDRLIDLVDESEQQKSAELQSLPAMPIDGRKSSDKIPDGYRKLGDSSEEPRQLGDLRWSISQKRYVEIGEEEIGYANRDNWAAYRKIEPVVKQSLTTEPPDCWRWLEVGEVIRKGDKYRDLKSQTWIGCVGAVGDSLQDFHKPTIRRNRFEVGEKVAVKDNTEIWEVDSIVNGVYQLKNNQGFFASFPEHLAPYIEETE